MRQPPEGENGPQLIDSKKMRMSVLQLQVTEWAEKFPLVSWKECSLLTSCAFLKKTFILEMGLVNYLPGLALNLSPPDLSLQSS
jgi:hypothetical protein